MVAKNTDEVNFDDVVDYKTAKKVAATAFVSYRFVVSERSS